MRQNQTHNLRPRARLAVNLLTVVAMLGTLAATPPISLAEPASVRDSTDKILRRLGGKPCPDSDFTCVTVQFPLDHFDPANSHKISLVFAVMPASGKRKGMFVTATGGPGTSGLAAKDSYTAAFDPSIPRAFDIVFFDQRGVAASGGLQCASAAAVYYQTDGRAQTPAQEAAVKSAARTFARTCVSEMGSPAILPYLGTAQAVEDLEAFRQLMQDDKFWLYGESYGTQYAQTYAAEHAAHLAGLMLDGTVDLTLSGTGFLAQQAQAFNDTLVLTQQACNADPACADDSGGDALAAYDQLARQLKSHSIRYRYPLASGRTVQRDFTFGELETTAAGQMYSESDRMIWQRALATGQRGDLTVLARLLYLDLGVDPETLVATPDPSYSDAIYYSVECQDYGYYTGSEQARAEQYMRAGDPVDAATLRLASIFYGDLPCVYWPNASQDTTRPDPLSANGIPTLVLGATADPATPYANGVSVYNNLADGYLITQQGGPHIIFGRGNACPDDIVTAFLVKDKRPAQRETVCDGSVADEYVPLAPVDASDFGSPLEAFTSAESEINYLPEYYYWDGTTSESAGCAYGGGLKFEPDGDNTKLTLTQCAFSRGWSMTGMGSYDPNKDRFVLEVRVKSVNYKYVRTGDNRKVSTP